MQLMLVKYVILVTDEGPKSAQCRFVFFTLLEFTVSSQGKRLIISVSQRRSANRSANSQQNI